jgi:hypothetical protein
MTWLVWRQHRYELLGLVLGGILIALALVLGTVIATMMREELSVDKCQPAFSRESNLCVALALEARNRLQPFRWILVGLFFLPAIAGSFIGGPLFSREFERGTQRFAWAQTVTRLRWSAAKLGAVLFAGFVGAFAIVLAGSPSRIINGPSQNPFANFDIEGPAFISYVLFAIALCAFVGTLSRRIVTGMFVGLLLFGVLRLGVMHGLRPIYQPPVTVSYGVNEVERWTQFKLPENAWDFGLDYVDSEGRVVTSVRVNQLLRSYEPSSFNPMGWWSVYNSETGKWESRVPPDMPMARDLRALLAADGVFQRVRYQPAERYEPFQWIEATIFLVLSGALVAGTLLLLRKRDA